MKTDETYYFDGELITLDLDVYNTLESLADPEGDLIYHDPIKIFKYIWETVYGDYEEAEEVVDCSINRLVDEHIIDLEECIEYVGEKQDRYFYIHLNGVDKFPSNLKVVEEQEWDCISNSL